MDDKAFREFMLAQVEAMKAVCKTEDEMRIWVKENSKIFRLAYKKIKYVDNQSKDNKQDSCPFPRDPPESIEPMK